MSEKVDPGWAPAARVALGLLSGRGLSGSVLLAMRALVMILAAVAAASGLAALVFGAGSDEPRIDALAARFGISAAIGGSVIATSFIGRAGPELASEAHLASSLYQITMRRVLAAAAVGPVGLVLSWASGDATYVIFGTGLALLLMAVSGPTMKRLRHYQREVEEAGSDLSVMSALSRPYS